jgi:hypothetical protein
MHEAANQTKPGYREPVDGLCKLGCVHTDWRNKTSH